MVHVLSYTDRRGVGAVSSSECVVHEDFRVGGQLFKQNETRGRIKVVRVRECPGSSKCSLDFLPYSIGTCGPNHARMKRPIQHAEKTIGGESPPPLIQHVFRACVNAGFVLSPQPHFLLAEETLFAVVTHYC